MLQLNDLERLFDGGAPPPLPTDAKEKVDHAAKVVRAAADGGEAVYGINTGFGKLASRRIGPADTTALQRNLILSHCAGVGPPLPVPIVRLILELKVASLSTGASGAAWETVSAMRALLERDCLPVIPAQGSVGASGDLAPLAHLGAALIGEGMVLVGGEVTPAAEGLKRCGIEPVVLGPKEGLAIINGTQVSTALALAGLFRARRLAEASIVTGAFSTDAAMGSTAPFQPEIHTLRGQRGQIDVAERLAALLAGSHIRESHRDGDERVQDPYCLRCQPQVLGACVDLLASAARTLHIEANAVTDNPLVLSSGDIVSGGNFHAEPVAFAADQIALAIAEIGAIAQRRVALLVDPALSFGLPPFLTPRPGLNSGLMIAEVTSAALMSENKQRAAPASVDSTPTSANQEDHVSMACHGARRLLDMADNLSGIIAVEAITGAQGIDLRAPLKTSPRLIAAHHRVREAVPFLDDDRLIAPDIEAAKPLTEGPLADAAGLPALEIAP